MGKKIKLTVEGGNQFGYIGDQIKSIENCQLQMVQPDVMKSVQSVEIYLI